MKQLMVVAVLAGALTGLADSSYTYTTGDAGSGAVAITYDGDTTNIKTLTANTAGDTISISGDAMTFADGATITLASSGTVSFAQKVTTLGAATLVRGDDVYREWSGTAMSSADPGVLAFPDIVTNDTISAADVANTWECIHVVGGAPSGAAGMLSAGRYDRIAGIVVSGNFTTLNRSTVAFDYSIRVQLSPRVNGTYVRCRTGVRTPRRGLYPDLEGRWATADLWANTEANWGPGQIARADRGIFGVGSSDATTYGGQWLNYTSAMGLNTVILKRKGAVGGPMKVCFDGGAELGGTTTIPFGIEAVVAAYEGEGVAKFTQTFTGAGNLSFVAKPPLSDISGSVYMTSYIQTDSWLTLAENRYLSSVTNIVGGMKGGGHGVNPPSPVNSYFYDYDPSNDTATCQFQFKRSPNGIKFVLAKLRQNGQNVEIIAEGCGYDANNSTLGSKKYSSMSGYTVSTDGTDGNYGICNITATFGASQKSYVVIGGDIKAMYGSRVMFTGAADTKLIATVTSVNGLPAAGEAHVDNGTLNLAAPGGVAPGGGTTKIVVHSGGDLRNPTSFQLGNPSYQELVLDGGTLFTGSETSSESFYVHYAMLSNAVLKGKWSPRVAYNSTYQYWRIIGDEPTTVLDGGNYWVDVYGYSSAANARSGNCAFRVEVQDVTSRNGEGDSEPDFIIPAIRGAAGRGSDRESYTWFWFEKYGPGTIKVKNDSKDLRMESKLYNGTLLLAGNNIMTNEVQLLGGNLAIEAGKSNNNFGALTASKAGTITIGEGGSLGFASFAPDANLATKSIMIDAPLEGNFLKFNSSVTNNLGYFRWKDDTAPRGSWRVQQDANGYLHPLTYGTAIFIR